MIIGGILRAKYCGLTVTNYMLLHVVVNEAKDDYLKVLNLIDARLIDKSRPYNDSLINIFQTTHTRRTFIVREQLMSETFR